MPLDIIAAPAANVALPLGIDEMLHLGHRVRHVRRGGHDVWDAWAQALADMWRPILASMLIVASGFALFLLSDFPPTQRLGVLVHRGDRHRSHRVGCAAGISHVWSTQALRVSGETARSGRSMACKAGLSRVQPSVGGSGASDAPFS
jgi:MMPL family